jgi:hypothetical protein
MALFATTGELHAQMRGGPMMARPMFFTPFRPFPVSASSSFNSMRMFSATNSTFNNSRMSPSQAITFNQAPTTPFVINQNLINMRGTTGTMNPYWWNRYGNNPYMNGYAYGLMYGAAYGGGYGYGGGGSYGGGYTPYTVPTSGTYAARSNYSYDGDAKDREEPADSAEKRRKAERQRSERSRDNPPKEEVLSGKSLNLILGDLQALTADDHLGTLPATELPLDGKLLQQINVAHGAGNVAVLKNGGRLSWPAALSTAEFQNQRTRLTEKLEQAVKQAENDGRVDHTAIGKIAASIDQLRQQLRDNAQGLSFDQHFAGKNFLDSLDAALLSLGESDVRSYFNGKFTLASKTVPELVQHMTQNGLRFAPAVAGDEPAYLALHQALAEYRRAVSPNQGQN